VERGRQDLLISTKELATFVLRPKRLVSETVALSPVAGDNVHGYGR